VTDGSAHGSSHSLGRGLNAHRLLVVCRRALQQPTTYLLLWVASKEDLEAPVQQEAIYLRL